MIKFLTFKSLSKKYFQADQNIAYE